MLREAKLTRGIGARIAHSTPSVSTRDALIDRILTSVTNAKQKPKPNKQLDRKKETNKKGERGRRREEHTRTGEGSHQISFLHMFDGKKIKSRVLEMDSLGCGIIFWNTLYHRLWSIGKSKLP